MNSVTNIRSSPRCLKKFPSVSVTDFLLVVFEREGRSAVWLMRSRRNWMQKSGPAIHDPVYAHGWEVIIAPVSHVHSIRSDIGAYTLVIKSMIQYSTWRLKYVTCRVTCVKAWAGSARTIDSYLGPCFPFLSLSLFLSVL